MLYQFENFIYDDDKGHIQSSKQNQKLTKTQKKLLNFFLSNPRTIHTKQILMEKVWGRIITENSVDQVISILRGYIEDNPKEPNKIVTHYGHGISFEAQVTKINVQQDTAKFKRILITVGVMVFIALLGIAFLTKQDLTDDQKNEPLAFNTDKKILILPTVFAQAGITPIEQLGAKSLLKSAFNSLESEGQMIFDETSLTTQQAIEKHWQRESDLVFLKTKIIKNGNAFQGEIELTDGINTLKKTTVSAESMNGLLRKQMMVISDLNHETSSTKIDQIMNPSADKTFIQALGLKNDGDLKQARTLLEGILSKKDDFYLARLTLAEILFETKQYDKSLSQLETLKATHAYKLMGTEIELAIAEIRYIHHEYTEMISHLKKYQLNHLEISTLKKAKIKLLLAKAYLAKADNKKAFEYYQQSIINIDPQLNPLIYAQSYLGQAKVLLHQTVGQEVYSLYEKALMSAQLAGNLHYQILALNNLSQISLSNYEWEKSINQQKQAIELMELDNNPQQMASGLETLVTILNLRGQFSQAKIANERLGKIADELNSDKIRLHFMHYDAILAMNTFDWIHAQNQIEKTLALAVKIGDYGMQLNNAFTALELILLKKDTTSFMPEWNKREELIQKKNFERFQVYMDLYLARYYKQIERNQEAIDLLENISEILVVNKDIKILVDAQNQLAMVYLKSNPTKALAILNNLEQHNPHPNPYLDLKAQALYKTGKNIEALNILNQAKLVYHESWTAENQALMDSIKTQIKG